MQLAMDFFKKSELTLTVRWAAQYFHKLPSGTEAQFPLETKDCWALPFLGRCEPGTAIYQTGTQP